MCENWSFEINCSLNTLFIIWFGYVFYSITFVLRNTRRNVKEFVHLLVEQPKFMLNFALFL